MHDIGGGHLVPGGAWARMAAVAVGMVCTWAG